MIKLQRVRFTYHKSDFSLDLPQLEIGQGEKVALVGPSGCGKTTLLNLISGICLPQTGSVHLGDTPMTGLSDRLRRNFRVSRIGQVFQRFELIEYLRVLDNILLPFLINKSLRLTADVKRRARTIAGDLGMSDKLNRFPTRLSQGEQQRVAIARAMLIKPDWILADEPTGSLDPQNKLRIKQQLFRLSEQHGSTLVVVTHDMGILDGFDRVIDFAEFHARPAIGAVWETDAADTALDSQAPGSAGKGAV